ncbi:DUF1641 domain-containing protein [Zooshikella marina]|uniref:DUF1641 domain-containing protein n=1 Tax=Zooshikella ganghwensis TaxID=202772 RepID=A0A4P9VQB0_9GAMM|nr:DUF1641 domain-containing protein [Zooshikella ganghwensis]MBU2704770.1 DUF1641 domain-containing protein [Zooshikella ganghwensis]RDH45196.1 DUF1641 domain-containing protein [Zooshikella ganghwensis]
MTVEAKNTDLPSRDDESRTGKVENIDTAGLDKIIEKISPLAEMGRFDNIVDLLSLISDNIEFLDEAMLEKLSKTGEDLLALSWTTGNAIRMANANTEKLQEPPSLFQLIRAINDPEVRRALHFIIEFMRIIGRQMKTVD